MHRLKGFVELLFDTVEETTNLVERTHRNTARRSIERFAPIEPVATPARAVNAAQQAVAGGVYTTIRTINRGVRDMLGSGVDIFGAETAAVLRNEAVLLDSAQIVAVRDRVAWAVDQAQAGVSGFYGDWLSKRDSSLAPTMHLRHEGRSLPIDGESFRAAFDPATSKLCVFVHGLSCTEWMWNIGAEQYYGDSKVNFGSQLSSDLRYTPLYLRYNSGLHVSENGKRLSELLAQVLEAYPVEVDEIALIGHSMGGLVCRSAAHYGNLHGQAWVAKLRHVVCLGAPHLGAPLEKAVNLTAGALRRFETAATEVLSDLLNARSSGVKDLRFGYIKDEEWRDKDPDAILEDGRDDVPLVDHVGYYFVAATISKDPEHPLGQVVGDLLVRLPSAAGHAPDPVRRIPFHSGHVLGGVSHLRLANHPEVYEAVRKWMTPPS